MASERLVAVGVLAACSAAGTPAITPSTIAVDDQSQPLRIDGVASADYLATSAGQLVLAADYQAVIGGVPTVVASADGAGVTVTLAQPLSIGSYPLDLVAGTRAWHVDGALTVVAAGALVDAGSDAVHDAGDAGLDAVWGTCFGTGLVNVCPNVTPTGTLSLPSGALDTDSSPLCVAFDSHNGTIGCLVAAEAITMSGNTAVTATGSRPLILLATSTLTLSGNAKLDVASHVNGTIGAGSAPSCAPGTLPTGDGGGYGASFGGLGGDGGNGGTAPAVAPITAFAGGCPGSTGAGASPGLGGRGGGAIYLLAGATLTMSGNAVIDASGASGLGGVSQSSGAGGGGSGGLIGLEAATITLSGNAKLFANGGAGGEGCDLLTPGNAGTDSSSPTQAATGGAGGSVLGGDGGDGSVGTTLAGAPGSGLTSGGGGGGGGAGVIAIHATTSSSISIAPSPPAS